MVNTEKRVLALYLGVIGLVLMLASLALPAWNLHVVYTSPPSVGDINAYGCGVGFGGHFNTGKSFMLVTDPSLNGQVQTPLLVLLALTIITIILAIVAILIARRGMRNPGKKTSGIMMIVASIFAIATPLSFMMQWPPNALGSISGFFGSMAYSDSAGTWGGSYGWYLQIAAFVMLLFAALLLLPISRAAPMPQYGPQPMPQYQQAPPQGYQAPPPQQQYQQASVRCTNCGTELSVGDFCPNCGYRVR